jgi:hypothetical protein
MEIRQNAKGALISKKRASSRQAMHQGGGAGTIIDVCGWWTDIGTTFVAARKGH